MSDDDGRGPRERPDDATPSENETDADGPVAASPENEADAGASGETDADDGDEWRDDELVDLPTGDETVPEDDPFEEMDVDVADGEAAWDDVDADADEAADPDADRDVRVVSDRTCHSCRFFADPPETACTHEGTEIRRVVDTDHFEVVDCPMVLEDVDVTEIAEDAPVDRDSTESVDDPTDPDADVRASE